jgi:hypothetical protein
MTNQDPKLQLTTSYPPQEKKTLKREIKRTWEWLIFSWHNLKRIGGVREIISTLTGAIILLIQRSWRQYKRKLNK